ncbi:HutD family protein [Kitasatospora sp. NPDC048540]|uniref:HutD/Ves family protein n=1 Tax=unclassified Kitasatospora TaxID=2633591 RepID=UPI00053A8C95|nr:HutD family protein [Kitasatospora sp. MBT63]
MAIQVLRAHDRAASPWLNGGGVTREVAGFPAGAALADFAWRVSLADVAQGGPFSRFDGVDRVITVVEGDGMALTVDGAEHRLAAPFEPFAFPGDAATDCRLLGGPVVDFNVMTRRGHATAQVEVTAEGRALRVPAGADLLLVCLAGEARLDPDGSGPDRPEPDGVRLGRFDAALLPGGATALLRVAGTAALVTLTPPATG